MDGNREADHDATGSLTGMTNRPGHPVRGVSASACYTTRACYSLHTHHMPIGLTRDTQYEAWQSQLVPEEST